MNRKFKDQADRKITIQEKEIKHLVDMDNISHIICVGKVSKIYHVENNTFYTTVKLLKIWEDELSGFGFVRINRSTLINMKHVACYKNTEKPTVTLKTKNEFSVSNRKISMLNNIFDNNKKGT